MMGDRLGHKVALPKLKLAAAWVILSPYLPLLFMGEEYNDTAPFPYFVSHGDPQLVEAVREGRKREFAAFAWEGEPPDPQSEATFASARIRPELRSDGEHRNLFEFYRELIRIRKTLDPLSDLSRRGITVQSDQDLRTIWVQRKYKQKECILVFSFSETTQSSAFPFECGSFRKCLDSADEFPSKHGSDSHPEFVWNRGEDVPLAAHAVLVVERRSTKGD
jgi:maltooligosyltrehalose trehalohydrolase